MAAVRAARAICSGKGNPFLLGCRVPAPDNGGMPTAPLRRDEMPAPASPLGGVPGAGDPLCAVAALAVSLQSAGVAPAAFRLLPFGRFRAADGSGRPVDVAEGWLLDAAGAESLVATFAARSDARVIDYEHQTLRAEHNGRPAPAAGWIGRLEVREDGVYAAGVEWTAAAAAHIVAREYRFISPVFTYDTDSGSVLEVVHAALVNCAGLDGLTDLAGVSALVARRLGAASVASPFEEEIVMKALLVALGLPQVATEDAALAALAALRQSHAEELAALRVQVGGVPDPAAYVAMSAYVALQSELAALQASVEGARHEALMVAALADGRILPATEAYWRSAPVAALQAYLQVAQPMAALSGMQSGGKAPESGGKAAFAVPPGFVVDAERLALHQRVVAHAAAHQVPYEQALAALSGRG